jgi:hypothetical protein
MAARVNPFRKPKITDTARIAIRTTSSQFTCVPYPVEDTTPGHRKFLGGQEHEASGGTPARARVARIRPAEGCR